ncbi:MAG: hypothetical protein R3F21_10330 [Myxococcota bacterium]
MNLELESGPKIDNPTPEQVSKSLQTLDGAGNSFVILAKDQMNYVQASGGPESGFSVEYQTGSIEEHFGTTRLDLPLATVDSIFRAYAANDPRWTEATTWAHQELKSASQARFPFIPSALAAGMFLVYLWWKNAA